MVSQATIQQEVLKQDILINGFLVVPLIMGRILREQRSRRLLAQKTDLV